MDILIVCPFCIVFPSQPLIFTLRVSFPSSRTTSTAYDMWREQDTINPVPTPDIMLLSHEDEGDSYHPYWYARVLGISHVNIEHSRRSSRTPHVQKFERLFVWWFGGDIMRLEGVHAAYIASGFFHLTLQAHYLLILSTLFVAFT